MDIPVIPDSYYKLMLTAGVALILYAFYQIDSFDKYFDSNTKALQIRTDSLERNADLDSFDISQMNHYYNGTFRSPTERDSLNVFYSKLNDFQKDSIWVLYSSRHSPLHDSINNIYKQLKLETFRLLEDYKFHEKAMVELYNEGQQFVSRTKEFYIQILFGGLFVFIGLKGFIKQQNYQDELNRITIEQNPTTYEYCQSCGEKFSALTTYDKNEPVNKGFCSQCYSKGKFTEPDLTVKDVIGRTAEYLEKTNLKSKDKKRIIERIYVLDRWKIRY